MATRSGIAASTKHPQTVRYPSQHVNSSCVAWSGYLVLYAPLAPYLCGGAALGAVGWSWRKRAWWWPRSDLASAFDDIPIETGAAGVITIPETWIGSQLEHHSMRNCGSSNSLTRPATLSCAPPKRWHLHHEWDLHRRTLSHGRCALQLPPLAWRAPPLACWRADHHCHLFDGFLSAHHIHCAICSYQWLAF